MTNKTEVIKIDPVGKYILLVTGASVKQLQDFSKIVKKWWFSSSPVLIVSPTGVESIKLEKINDTTS